MAKKFQFGFKFRVFRNPPSPKSFSSRSEWENAAWKYCAGEFSRIRSGGEFLELLEIFLSKRERKNILKRILTTLKLDEGKSYKEIGRELWVSPQTVSAIKKSLNVGKHMSARGFEKKTRPKRFFAREKIRKAGRVVKTKYGPIRLSW